MNSIKIKYNSNNSLMTNVNVLNIETKMGNYLGISQFERVNGNKAFSNIENYFSLWVPLN